MLSLIIPVYNEESAIADTVRTAHDTLRLVDMPFEILVVDDASTDGTAEILATLEYPELTVERHPRNRGYSASIKTGIRRSHGEYLAITDADGTYPIAQFPVLLRTMQDTRADMVVGARTKKGANIPLIRRPAKWIVNRLANTLTGVRIPDLNSGMRIFTRPLAEQFMHLYPQRFSFTITITLAAFTNDYIVEYVPIDYFKRAGKSTLSSGFNGISNFINFLSLIVRITTYFRPMKFFLWPGLLLMLGGIALIVYTISVADNVSDAGLLLLVSGLQISLFGLLAEITVKHRQ